jgi:hypothetical protein
MAHPVVEQQRAMENPGNMAGGSAAPPEYSGLTSDYVGEFTDKAVPNMLAAMVLGSVGTLILLRLGGFRFSFGVNVGGGS